MRAIWILPAGLRRRVWLTVTCSAFVLIGASLAHAQEQPAAQAAPGRTFTADAGMIFNQIKPDKTADFEMVMGKLREALSKSEDPVRKQQAAGWKLFKSLEPAPGGNVLYIFILDPAVKGADYSVSKILAEVFPTEVQDLYKTFSDAYAGGQNIVNLQQVSSFKAGGAGAQQD